MASARPHPPSEQRIREARAAGHVPRAPLAGFAGALLAVVAAGPWLGPELAVQLGRLLEVPLLAVAADASARAHAEALGIVRALLATSARALALALAGGLLGAGLAGGLHVARARGARARFPRIAPSRAASLLFALGLALVTGLALADVAYLEPSELGARVAAWAIQLALLALGAGVVDALFARARFYASLFMTRRELLDEQREALGAPALRTARARMREGAR